MTKQLLKLLSEKPYHADHQERARLVRNWKHSVAQVQQQLQKKVNNYENRSYQGGF